MSKSEEKRGKVQKSKVKTKEKAPKLVESGSIEALILKKLEKLEEKQKVIIDSFEFVANETRPLYGLGSIALIFDAIYKKLKK